MVRSLIWSGALFSLELICSAAATPRDDMRAAMERCNVFEDEKTYLDCVYGAAQPVRAELGLPPAPQEQRRLVPSASANVAPQSQLTSRAPQSRDWFANSLFGSGKVQAQSQMAAYSFDKAGYFTVMLRNGEVWKQVEGGLVKWRQPASQYLVTVRSGAMGSSNLQVDGESGLFKVKRIR